eukprot:CAMPEP_0176492458 /NCGR_PEP_ID=MMETSP0200_2-20121128/9012_1 /TAXON_ID=947934 /ORGANISM="Chaetoceros sp., Strain GSL56" /LENGTH=216 /DNA_ID=CAMNT_0017890027 /DNA_START=92 /DNA_END=742 /DNA_ORIENTATION=-
MSIASWDDEYARISRAASQLRTTPGNGLNQPHPTARAHQIRSVQTGLTRLKSNLMTIRNSGMVNSAEIQRRLGLIDNLERQFGASASSGLGATGDLLGLGGDSGGGAGRGSTHSYHGGGNQTLAAQALRHQDDMIDELAVGVSRLKDQTLLINDEANMQNRMLSDMDSDVENARTGLEAETLRAMKLKEDQSVWRLYLIIAGLSILLFLLILTGLN